MLAVSQSSGLVHRRPFFFKLSRVSSLLFFSFLFDAFVRNLCRIFNIWRLQKNKKKARRFLFFQKFGGLFLCYWLLFKEFCDDGQYLGGKTRAGRVVFWRRSFGRRLFRLRLRRHWVKRRRFKRWKIRARLRGFFYRLTGMRTYYSSSVLWPGGSQQQLVGGASGGWNYRFLARRGLSGLLLGPLPVRFIFYFFQNKFMWFSLLSQLGAWGGWRA